VVDLFSGAGGMSTGFARFPNFAVVGAADAEIGKPSSGIGTLGCNGTYRQNIGIDPIAADLGQVDPEDLGAAMGLSGSPTVLIACPPCTGFSRTLARNHLEDDARNSLVRRVALFARQLQPEIIVMENARELLMGRFATHFEHLRSELEGMDYEVAADIHFLSDFGLPQKRERALAVAVKRGYPLRDMNDLWSGLEVVDEATHVRHAISHLPAIRAGEAHPLDRFHAAPSFNELNQRRFAAIPHDGGSWFDLLGRDDEEELLTDTMKRRAIAGDLGSHPDVYGRLAWDRPAATIKRECGHVGNGRYAHPEQDRLCSVRELALLQGFPSGYVFDDASLTNMYRHVGDAVPPLISFQIAALVSWILSDERPEPADLVLPDSSLKLSDLRDS
jgi:DNA (cytosine-5)-methyltransferase 1